MDRQSVVFTFRDMRTRLQRLKERETQKLVGVIFGGKLLGVGATLGAIKGVSWYFDTAAGAQEAIAHKANDLVNPINTMWVLITAFLVFFMQAGFMALEAGFARERESVNIMLECIVDTCLCALLFFAFGFAFMFGEGNKFIGTQFFFLNDATPTYGTTGIAFMAFFLFQFAFADTASTITSGAMVGRTGFVGDLVYSFFVSGFICLLYTSPSPRDS